MKKILCVILSILMLPVLSSCSLKKDDVSETAVIEWIKYLDKSSETVAGYLWALPYIEEYCKNPSSDGYSYALSAASALNKRFGDLLSSASFGFGEVTGEDEKSVALINEKMASLKAETVEEREYISSLLSDFTTDAFFSEGIEYIQKSAEMKKEEILLEAVTLRVLTNYILVSSGYKAYPSAVVESSNGIIDVSTPFMRETDEIISSLDICLKNKEEQKAKKEDVKKAEEVKNGILESTDISALYASCTEWGKELTAVPLMENKPFEITAYHYPGNETENVCFIRIGDDIKSLTADYSVCVSDVTKDEYTDYIGLFVTLGGKYSVEEGSFSDDGDMFCLVKFGEDILQVYFEEGKCNVYMDTEKSFICKKLYGAYNS